MKRFLRRLIQLLAALLLMVAVLAVCCFTVLDKTPYRQTTYYKRQMELIDSVPFNFSMADSAALLAGWARVNLQPPFTTPIAIDAHRGGRHYKGVHDSVYVRAFVFKCGNRKVAFISADLLIVPPTVSAIADSILRDCGFSNENIYYTATHTHSSIGAWHNSWVGEKFAGKYDERVPAHLAQCFKQAILLAEKECTPAEIGFAALPTRQLVFNRLVDEGRVDSTLRVVKIKKDNGKTAAIITFAAHATVYHESMMQLCNDWPGVLMAQLQQPGQIDFVSFSAGAVGSQGPFEYSGNQDKEAAYMAAGVQKVLMDNFDSIPVQRINNFAPYFGMCHLQLYLRQPNLRVSENLVLRPWLFKKLFGDNAVYVNIFRIGDIVLEGMPCDFSGELVPEIDSVAHFNKLKTAITSFNGGYIGYITHDSRYNLNTYETRTMGWFGPQNGAYLTEILQKTLKKPVF